MLATFPGLQMEGVSDYSAIDITANPISDAGSFFLLVPPFIFEQWTSYRTPDISADGHTSRVNTERAFAGSIDGGAETQAFTQRSENHITDIHDEGLPVIKGLVSGSMYRTTFPRSPSPLFDARRTPLKKATSTLLETEGSSVSGPAISNESQTDINLADEDKEGVLMNARLGHGQQYTRIHTTSASSIPQGISSKPTVSRYLGDSVSRDGSQKSHKSGNVPVLPEKASSQSRSLAPAGIGGALGKGPYSCDICGKMYAQRQGVRRHFRAIHDRLNSCSYCDFTWSRLYIYRAHLKTKHRNIVSDMAQDEATSTSHRVVNTTSSKQRQSILTLAPEHGQRGGTEAWQCPLTLPPSAAVEIAPARLPAIHHVDHDSQPIESSEPTIRRKRQREDAPESGCRTKLLSTEVRALPVKDLDMPVRKAQTLFQDEVSPPPGGRYGLSQMSYADTTYSHLALLPSMMRSGNVPFPQ